MIYTSDNRFFSVLSDIPSLCNKLENGRHHVYMATQQRRSTFRHSYNKNAIKDKFVLKYFFYLLMWHPYSSKGCMWRGIMNDPPALMPIRVLHIARQPYRYEWVPSSAAALGDNKLARTSNYWLLLRAYNILHKMRLFLRAIRCKWLQNRFSAS